MLSIFSKAKINVYLKFYNIYKNLMKNNENTTLLHRWCNTTSPVYKDTCNWEKKLEIAQHDNCYINNFLKKVSKNEFITNKFLKKS